MKFCRSSCSARAGEPACLVVLAALYFSVLATAQSESQSVDSVEQRPAALRLPAKLADGRPLRATAVFQKQLSDLVPKTYEPVALDELADAISNSLREVGDAGTSRVKSSFYDIRFVDGDLISERDRSSIVIESDQPGIVRRSLGSVNLAFTAKESVLPRFEFAGNGDLIAVLPADASRSGLSTINFSWSLVGQSNGPYRDFVLRIPRTPETRIVLSTPVNVEVVARDGVLRSRASIPPGAEPRSQPVRWYEIEAGGLSRIRLHQG